MPNFSICTAYSSVEHFQHHVKHVAFGPAGVYDLIKEPTEDQIDTLDLLKLMRTRREEKRGHGNTERMCLRRMPRISDDGPHFHHTT